jgi:superfamily II DNA or RNA helicase|tara:strand:+ start:4922 stop:6763 length:1842 start_codon:yes stop_codon:yes gene_type:complete
VSEFTEKLNPWFHTKVRFGVRNFYLFQDFQGIKKRNNNSLEFWNTMKKANSEPWRIQVMLLTIEGKYATLHTRMTPAIMMVLPRLEGRRKWLKGGGLKMEATDHNMEVLKEGGIILDIKDPILVQGDDLSTALGFAPYEQKTTPYNHQIIALERCTAQKSFALFMEQGTGKTKVAIDHAGGLFCAGKITGVLVVAPKGVHRQWVDEQLPTHSGCEFTAGVWPQLNLICPLFLLPEELCKGEDLKWLAINIDGIKTAKGRLTCLEFIKSHKGKVLMIVDESHTIKNAKSKRWKAANELGNCVDYRLALTGTPIAKDLTEEWAQFKWLDERIIGIRYITAFRNEYCIMGGFEGRAIVGHKNVERLQEKVKSYTFRATKEDIGILPKAYDRWKFDLSKKQRSMIKEMKKLLITQIDSGEISTASNAAVAVMRMQQIASGFMVDDDENIIMIEKGQKKNPRLTALAECLESIEGKVIIWARFVKDIELIKSMLGDDCVTYYGATSDKERKLAIERFLSEEEGSPRYFVSNPAAGGVGLNLQGQCRRAVYYSNSDNSIERWQSEDRIHRIGVTGGVVYTDLIGVGSVDAKILRNLRNKKTVSDMALGDIRNWLEEEEW